MEPYPGTDKKFHLWLIESNIAALIKGEFDPNIDSYGSIAPGAVQARIAKTLSEMGYSKVIKPRPPSYYSPEERDKYWEENESSD